MLSQPVYQLQQVSHHFNRTFSLQEITCNIQAGERVALVGSSGAGKSTLLRLLNASLAPTSGELSILGRSVQQLNARSQRHLQRQIGTIYQQFHLIDSLRVIHNVNAGRLGNWSLWKSCLSLIWPHDRASVLQALQQVGIPEQIDARTDQLSGGQQQRVAIARVLVQNPTVILADEPIASLDPTLSHEVMGLLTQLATQKQRTLIVSLHDVAIAQQYCDRMIGLKQGKIQFDAPVAAVEPDWLKHLYG
jgi:phosphonate transport system ATP-binding protein